MAVSTETRNVDLVGDEVVGNVARAALLAALTGAFAYVTFPNPVSPTSVTLQVLGVFLAGLLLGPVWGGVSMVLYLAAGAVGAPVFLGGSAGFGNLVGTTAGYLWSYPLAAFVIGLVAYGRLDTNADLDAGLPRIALALTVGTVVIYALGVVGLMLIGGLGLEAAVVGGALTFIPAEALKAVVAVGVVRSGAIATS
jgi:biotin transport system substrate-specific component